MPIPTSVTPITVIATEQGKPGDSSAPAEQRAASARRNGRRAPLRNCRLPTLFALLAPELEGRLAAELQPPFKQRHR